MALVCIPTWVVTTPFSFDFTVQSGSSKNFQRMLISAYFFKFIPTQGMLILYRAQKKFQSGKIRITASVLPAFLWAGDLLGKDYDDDNIFEGMFEGHLLERVCAFFYCYLMLMFL
jgi:hypothetical protein